MRTGLRREGSSTSGVFKDMGRKAAATTHRDPELIDEAFECYVMWREKRTAVRDAYAAWRQAPARDRVRAFHTYVSALDGEERAANEYERVVELVRRGMD